MACANPLDIELMGLQLSGRPVVSPDEPGEFRADIENTGDTRVVWGTGSSSCQLDLFVIASGRHHRIDSRVCTADLVEQGLGPGEHRTELFEWDGRIPDGGNAWVVLPEGTYAVYASAGDRAQSDRLQVRVQP